MLIIELIPISKLRKNSAKKYSIAVIVIKKQKLLEIFNNQKNQINLLKQNIFLSIYNKL